MGPPPAQLADDVDNGSRDAGVLGGVHEALLDLGPGGAQGLGIDQGQAIEGDERLLSDVGMAVAQTREQVGQGRERERGGDDVGEGGDGQRDDDGARRGEVLG